MQSNTLNTKRMNTIKLVTIIILLGFLGLRYSLIAQDKNQNGVSRANKFEFPSLPYNYDALEPYIDKQTVEIHYSKHHRAYYDNFLNAIKGSKLENMEIINIFKNISKYPVAVRNNAGGYYNHTFYWESMKANGSILTTNKLSEAIIKTFGSIDEFKKQFSDAGKTRFGSGWAWLCIDNKGKLFVCSTPNQDNPLMDISERKGIPLLAMDVWEHAYYIKYQNKRADYIQAFLSLIDWEEITKRYENALKALSIK